MPAGSRRYSSNQVTSVAFSGYCAFGVLLGLTGLVFYDKLVVCCWKTETFYDVYLVLLAPVTFVAELSQFSAGGGVRVNRVSTELFEKPPLKGGFFILRG